MVVTPDRALVMGGTWRIPVLAGLQSKSTIDDQKNDSTMSEASFGREYESIWSGVSDNAFFDGEIFDRNRMLLLPEYKYNKRTTNGTLTPYYIFGIDVGRKSDLSVVAVFRVNPQPTGPAIKSLVYIEVLEDAHYEDQAKRFKELYYLYEPRRMVIDANGPGLGLVDYMVKPTIIHSTGERYPGFGVYNDKDKEYSKYRTNDTVDDILYLITANPTLNTEAHVYFQTQLATGKVKFLIDERTAKEKLLSTKVGQAMKPEEREKHLLPYVLTTILKNEMLNLYEKHEGFNIILERDKRSIKKDKFSACEYALYYIKTEEESRQKKKKFKATDFMFKS